MKRFPIIALAVIFSVISCNDGDALGTDQPQPQPTPSGKTFAKGADISWVTEMESEGYKFYNTGGQEKECTAILAELGFNAVRYRVWVNPEGGWCSKEDVLKKALRAKAFGMEIMIDFHYSDRWADPGKQNVPGAWKGYDRDRMASAVAEHTEEVLTYLKTNGIDVSWIQIGNEVENGMLWESGRVSGTETGAFAQYFNSGRNAAKGIFPDAGIILHISNAWDTDTSKWFFSLMEDNGVEYDMIGLSLYPSYWENGKYPDWETKTAKAVAGFNLLHSTFGKEIMLVEFGMPASEPQKSAECLEYIMENTSKYDWFKGIFFWEPESEESRMNYSYGAFKDGCPTAALDPFKQ